MSNSLNTSQFIFLLEIFVVACQNNCLNHSMPLLKIPVRKCGVFLSPLSIEPCLCTDFCVKK